MQRYSLYFPTTSLPSSSVYYANRFEAKLFLGPLYILAQNEHYINILKIITVKFFVRFLLIAQLPPQNMFQRA